MNIKKDHYYRIKNRSPYFLDKYGDETPMVLVKDIDSEILKGKRWYECITSNNAVQSFVRRQVKDNELTIPYSLEVSTTNEVYYVKIMGKDNPWWVGEFVYKHELCQLDSLDPNNL